VRHRSAADRAGHYWGKEIPGTAFAVPAKNSHAKTREYIDQYSVLHDSICPEIISGQSVIILTIT
jgi:hypothetical protein